MHIRNQLRNAIGNELLTVASLEGRVYMSRVYPFSSAALPGVNVRFNSETISEEERANVSGGREIFRAVTIDVVVNLMGQDSDDEFDEISADIESTLYASDEIKCLAKDWVLASTEIEVLPEAEDPITLGTMSWVFLYANIDTEPRKSR